MNENERKAILPKNSTTMSVEPRRVMALQVAWAVAAEGMVIAKGFAEVVWWNNQVGRRRRKEDEQKRKMENNGQIKKKKK